MFQKKARKISFILFFVVILTGCDTQQKSGNNELSFDDFTKEVFINEVQNDTLSLNYSLANPLSYGIEDVAITLGEFGVKQFESDLSESEEYLHSLKSFSYDSLTMDQQLTYDILLKYLEQDLASRDYIYYTQAIGPTTGLQAQLPILLAEYNFYTQKDIDNYLELLPCVYDYFKDVSEFEKEKSERGLFMSDRVADRIIDQCKAFIDDPENNFLITYFDEKILVYEGLTASEIKSYQKINKERILEYVIPSYTLLIDTLEELKGTGVNDGGLYYYPDGQSYYELLANIKTGSDRDMDAMADLLDKAIGDEVLKITQLSFSDSHIMNKLNDFTSFPITDPEAILSNLKKEIATDFPDPVPVNCEIKYVHESLADFLSPAMYLVPAMDDYMNNSIYINGADDENLAHIYTTVAHEGYPGHLYQCVYFRNQNPDPVRNVMNFTGYDEGWATYVEHYSYSLAGIDSNLADFLEANSTVILCMYGRADIGIHYEGWTKDKAIGYIKTFVGDVDISTEIYETLLEEPSIYLPYAIGFLEIEELRKKAENTLKDDFDAKDFHQFLLEIGPAQFSIIDNYMDEWLVSVNDSN